LFVLIIFATSMHVFITTPSYSVVDNISRLVREQRLLLLLLQILPGMNHLILMRMMVMNT